MFLHPSRPSWYRLISAVITLLIAVSCFRVHICTDLVLWRLLTHSIIMNCLTDLRMWTVLLGDFNLHTYKDHWAIIILWVIFTFLGFIVSQSSVVLSN
jgi:hypothetical protein